MLQFFERDVIFVVFRFDDVDYESVFVAVEPHYVVVHHDSNPGKHSFNIT